MKSEFTMIAGLEQTLHSSTHEHNWELKSKPDVIETKEDFRFDSESVSVSNSTSLSTENSITNEPCKTENNQDLCLTWEAVSVYGKKKFRWKMHCCKKLKSEKAYDLSANDKSQIFSVESTPATTPSQSQTSSIVKLAKPYDMNQILDNCRSHVDKC